MNIFERYKVDKLFVLATHVFADVAHFRKLIQEYPWKSQPDWIQWSLLENTLVKARAINEFLITDGIGHSDDFQAISIVPTWNSSGSGFTELRELVNKHVAHYSQHRFIEGKAENVENLDDLINKLTSVDIMFSKFESELAEFNLDLYLALNNQFLKFDV